MEINPSPPTTGARAAASPEPRRDRPARRACTSCARSKQRCVWSAHDAHRCQRCCKFNWDCTLVQPKPRRPRGKSTYVLPMPPHTGVKLWSSCCSRPASRVGQLEKKLDGLMNMLTANQPAQLTPSNSSSSPESNAAIDRPLPPPSATYYPHQDLPSPETKIDVAPGYNITLHEANAMLSTYREALTNQFPFVPLAPSTTASDLSRQTPLLFLAIVIVSAPHPKERRVALKQTFRDRVAAHIAQKKQCLELLQALLVHIAWNDFQMYGPSQDSDYLQLTVSLVIDLGLYKPPRIGWGLLPRSLLEEAAVSTKIERKDVHTVDEIRACLGSYYITTLISTLFRRPHVLPFNAYLSKCCDKLLEAQVSPFDALLVSLVRLQNVTSRVNNIVPIESDGAGSFTGAVAMSIASIRQELEVLVNGQPEQVKSNAMFWTHYQNTVMRLYEPAIYMQGPLDAPGVLFQRTEALWSCLESARAFFDYCLTPADASMYANLPFPWTACLAFAMVTVSRLLLMEEGTPDWDVKLARKSFDLPAVLERVANRFQEDYSENGTTGTTGTTTAAVRSTRDREMYSHRMRWMRNWYSSRMPPPEAVAAAPQLEPFTPNFGFVPNVDMSLWDGFFEGAVL